MIRVRTAAGTVLLCALTLCADEQTAPSVTVHGTLGRAEFFYTEDRLAVTTPDGERTRGVRPHRPAGKPARCPPVPAARNTDC